MSEPLSPEYEAEIRDRVDRLDDNRTFPTATWLASSVSEKSVFPPEQSHVVEDVVQTASFVTRASVGVFGDKQHAEFTAHARDDVPALLAEIDRLRTDLAKSPDEEYLGELAHLRDLLRAVGRAADKQPKGNPITELLIDHYSDSRIVDAELAKQGGDL